MQKTVEELNKKITETIEKSKVRRKTMLIYDTHTEIHHHSNGFLR
jgi:hypothetical protein